MEMNERHTVQRPQIVSAGAAYACVGDNHITAAVWGVSDGCFKGLHLFFPAGDVAVDELGVPGIGQSCIASRVWVPYGWSSFARLFPRSSLTSAIVTNALVLLVLGFEILVRAVHTLLQRMPGRLIRPFHWLLEDVSSTIAVSGR